MNVLALPLNPNEEWNVVRSPNPGMSVLYIGLLAPLNRTMVRSGTIGAPNQTGIKFQGGWQYETHLVDCRSYGGFSGSPCFLELPVPEIEPDPHPPSFLPEGKKYGRMGWHAMFVGMFTAHLTDAPQEDDDTPHSRYGVGLMLPAHYIIDALTTEDIVKDRREADARELKVFPQVTPAGIEPQAETFGPTDMEDALRRATRITPQAESEPEG